MPRSTTASCEHGLTALVLPIHAHTGACYVALGTADGRNNARPAELYRVSTIEPNSPPVAIDLGKELRRSMTSACVSPGGGVLFLVDFEGGLWKGVVVGTQLDANRIPLDQLGLEGTEVVAVVCTGDYLLLNGVERYSRLTVLACIDLATQRLLWRHVVKRRCRAWFPADDPRGVIFESRAGTCAGTCTRCSPAPRMAPACAGWRGRGGCWSGLAAQPCFKCSSPQGTLCNT